MKEEDDNGPFTVSSGVVEDYKDLYGNGGVAGILGFDLTPLYRALPYTSNIGTWKLI